MTIQITIVGLGQIGASIGLGLANQPDLLHRVGHDRNQEVARQAEKKGALDKVDYNLPSAVRGADLVILALPMDQIRETMAIIATQLKAGAVVMDTAPIKEVVAAWAGELLPADRFYVGLTPVINPAYLHGTESGVEAARADLFSSGLLGIVAPPRTSSEAIKLAADLARLLGATPLFADPVEMDSLMAATHLLPQLLAAGLLNATVDQPGWFEGRKLAGRAYAEATGSIVHLSEPHTLTASVLLSREHVLRVLDSTIAALQAIRSDIEQQNTEALEARLERARRGREKWWKQRKAGDWINDAIPAHDLPDTNDMFGRLLGFGRKPKK
ncbi:MAG TPA: prephenate dehydrogenase/arogenate dehydrogenase family protein [Anaerolineales bacterium]